LNMRVLVLTIVKAIAAVAISRSFSKAETVSAGFFVSGVVLVFSITGLLQWFTHTIPIPVVKGIQVGAGLSLVLSAGSSLLQPLGLTSPSWADNLIWALFAFLALIFTQQFWRFPYAIVMFILAIVLALCVTGSHNLPSLTIWRPHIVVPSWADFKVGAIDAGLGQVPLTTLNSIIAVSYLSADLLPHLPAPSVTAMGISVAIMNLVGGWFGAMPVCHGSGGLAAQYRFGARSGSSIIVLGIFKIILGLIFGESLVGLLRQYPKSLLGVMVLAAGLELAKVGESLNYGARDLWEAADLQSPPGSGEGGAFKKQRSLSDDERVERWTVMLMTVAGLLAFRNDAVGFAAGLLCHWTYKSSSTAMNRWGGFTWTQRAWKGRRSTQPATVDIEEEQLLSEPDSPAGG
jgi:MFS superfamily sulfate permease-like transporter